MKTFKLSAMMFVQFLMLPVWVVPLLPYVQGLDGGKDWVFACGLLMGVGTFASPLVGMFADRFLNAEKVLAACNALTAAFLALAFFVRDPAVLFVVLLAAMLAYMPTWSVSSAIAMAHSSSAAFPRIRVFGSLGWVASGVFSVIGVRLFGRADFDVSPWIFASGAFAALLGAALALTLPSTPPKAKGTPMSVVDALGLKAFALFRDPVFATFGVLITLAMVPFYWYVVYNAMYLAESGFRYLTLTQNLGQVGEIVFMLTVPFIVRKCGYKWALVIGLLAVMFRYAAFYSSVRFGFAAGDFGGILIHGLAFGILCVGSQMYIDSYAPPTLRNQAQGLVMLLTNGVGLFLSNFVFQFVLDANVISADPVRHDWATPYALAFVGALVVAVAFAVAFHPKRAAVAAVALLLALPALAAEEITSARYPDADSVVVDEVEKVRYNPDGTYEQTDECWVKILTEKGRREESVVTLDYSRRYGEASIVSVSAIAADGTERRIDVSATTKESTDNSSMSANIYDPLDRKIVCTVPGLKVGETLHTKTARKTLKPRCKDKWADISVMEWSKPIVRSTFEVTAPATRPLRKIAIRHPLGNIVTNVTTRADGSVVHVFTVTNSPQAFPEPDMPPLYTQVQNIRVSTAADWPEVSAWYWDLCAPHLAKTNAAMVAKVAELGPDVRAIFKFVSQEVRYMGLTMEDTSPGYAPHDVDVTFDNRYGVCRDKAGLLVAMLRLAGFNAFPVLIHVGAKLDPEVPQPFFNHAIVAVDRGVRDYELMDPTNENAKDLFPAYLSDKSFLVARPDGDDLRTSPVTPPEENALIADSSGTLLKDGSLFFESALRFNGINDTAYRHAFVRKKPEDRVKFFEGVVKAIAPGAELVRCEVEPRDMRDTERPLEVKLAAKLPEMVLRGETRDELTVPFVSKALGMVNFLLRGNTSLDRRRYPLAIDTTARVAERLTLDLSGTLGATLEMPADEDGGTGGFRYVRRFAVTNDVLTAERALTIAAVEFSPDEYAELREDIKRVEAAERKRPVFARDGLKEANVRWLLDEESVDVASDREWVRTNVVVKEVLTYEGKKSSSELKFAYNPAVETIELVSAVVSNRDGKVYSVSEKEKNVMDCGWAAKAPRYPAGRLLVVNLPSVEIGSVISYALVRTVTNAPAAFYGSYLFDFHDPVDCRRVRVNDWRREAVRPRRLPNEPNQPLASLWRDQVIVSSNAFAALDLAVPSLDPAVLGLDGLSDDGPLARLVAIRDWMARFVRVAGPGLYELPIARQLTDPSVVLKERYATRLDYVRTLCALLRGAGYEADVVFASSDADEPDEVRRRIMRDKPNVRAFSAALCRVRVREGGFLGLGGDERVFFVGTENQYAPLGPSAYEGSDYFDPTTAEFGLVTVPDAEFSERTCEVSEYAIRENGAVDLTVENLMYGSGVQGFRKTYAEILPEDRSRRYQSILGGVAQAATATSDLETDVTSYPARRRFTCFIPDYAMVSGDAITIQIPPLVSSLPSCIGTARQTPFAVSAADCESEDVTIRFPEGYTEIESLPRPFAFANPLNPSEVWLESDVKTEVKDNCLTVRLVRKARRHAYAWFAADFYELMKDRNRIANSRSSRTVTARRRK